MEDVSRRVLKEAGVSSDQISLFIPHQANQRITHAVMARLGVGSDRVYSNIDRIGNTSFRVNSDLP